MILVERIRQSSRLRRAEGELGKEGCDEGTVEVSAEAGYDADIGSSTCAKSAVTVELKDMEAEGRAHGRCEEATIASRQRVFLLVPWVPMPISTWRQTLCTLHR